MPGDYFFLNYGVQDGNVMQGLFRVNKTTLQLEVYNGTQWVLAGGGGSSATATSMTTAERIAITPNAGALIWDTDLEKLFIGDGQTTGGIIVGSGNASSSDGRAIFTNTAASLDANTVLRAVLRCDNEKNDYITFFGNFTNFDTLRVSHCSTANHAYVLITNTEIQIYRVSTNTLLYSYEHGLTLSDFIYVVIHANDGPTSNISITTASGRYNIDNVPLTSWYADVRAVATMAMTNCEINYIVNDAKQDVWVFGDSYLELTITSWPIEFLAQGHRNVLFCGEGGAGSERMLESLRNLIPLAQPKYLCWFLGMNEQDSGAINTDWKTGLDEVLATCQTYGITPILATIPNTQSRDMTYKNAYVKSTGLRYVDFAAAVGATTFPGQWYPGMNSDGTHPSSLGAKALAHRFILDVPESVYTERAVEAPYVGGYGIDVNYKVVEKQRYLDIEEPTGSTVTLQAGHAYDVYALTSAVTLTTEEIPNGKFGLDGYLRLYLTSADNVIEGDNVKFAEPPTPSAINNCVIRFRNNYTVINVMDTIGGYTVVSSTGTSEGTLDYGITSTTSNYIFFSPSLNNQPIDMGGIVVNREVTIAGTGSSTILTGNISCTASATFMGVAMSGAVIAAGTPSLNNVYIPEGATIARGGGQFKFDNVNGPGFIDMGGSNCTLPGGSVYISGCTFSNVVTSDVPNGGIFMLNSNNTVKLENITLSGVTVTRGGLCFIGYDKPGNVVELTGCTVTNCTVTAGACVGASAGKIYAISCYFEKNTSYEFNINNGAELFITDCVFSSGYQNLGMGFTGNSGYVTLAGSNSFGNGILTSGGIVISSGASLGIFGTLSAGAGSNIEVRGGTCMVNGVIIESGYYNKIASSGGSAVVQ